MEKWMVCSSIGEQDSYKVLTPERNRADRPVLFMSRNSEYQRTWYLSNKETHSKRIKEQKLKRREFVNRVKRRYPCTDCGIRYAPYVMHFDHLGDKSFNISSGWQSAGRQKIKDEMRKCELVCANCHAVRTYTRANQGSIPC